MERADVLIVTAVPDEYAAVLDAGGGALAWTTQPGPIGLTVAFRDLAVDGGSLTIAVTQALGMGGSHGTVRGVGAVESLDGGQRYTGGLELDLLGEAM
jgi:hypothetical protein